MFTLNISNIIIYGFTFIFIISSLLFLKKFKIDARTICACGLASAATIILSLTIRVPIGINDASISFSTIPILLLAMIYGVPTGMVAGIITAILSVFLVPGWAPIHPLQFPVEHYVCFVALGLAGVFGTDKRYKIMSGVLLAYIFKITAHVLSGYLFFGSFAPEGMSPWRYTLVYNITSKGIEVVLVTIIMGLLPINAIKKSITGGHSR